MRTIAATLVLVLGCVTEEHITVGPDSGGADGVDGADGSTDGADGFGGTDGVQEDVGQPKEDIGSNCPKGPSQVCAENAKPPNGDKGCAFTGLSVSPQHPSAEGKKYEFTCTRCPGGKVEVKDGVYKYFESDEDGDPHADWPDPKEYAETLEFQGNFFINRFAGIDSGTGEFTIATTEGYYFCTDPDELQGMKFADFYDTVFVYLKVEPEGAFGINAGDADPCFLGVDASAGSSAIGIACNLFWDTKGSDQSENEYCRVGTMLNGKPCKHPFE